MRERAERGASGPTDPTPVEAFEELPPLAPPEELDAGSPVGWDPRGESEWRKAADREEPVLRGALDPEAMCAEWGRARRPASTPELPRMDARSQLEGTRAVARFLEEPAVDSRRAQVVWEVESCEGFEDARPALWLAYVQEHWVAPSWRERIGAFHAALAARWPHGFLPEGPGVRLTRGEQIEAIQRDVAETQERGRRKGRPKGARGT